MQINTTSPSALDRRNIPHLRELPADLETPVSVYLKLAGKSPSFLLESVTGGEQLARYSFIGVGPSRAYLIYGHTLHTVNLTGERQAQVQALPGDQDPMDALRQVLANQACQPLPGLPRFSGGLVGYMSYEMMRFFEPSVKLEAHPELPDAVFLLADTLVAFDHAFGKILLIGNPGPDASAEEVEARLDEIEKRLAAPLPASPAPRPAVPANKRANMSADAFCNAVLAAKEHIAAGDIFQVVLSQRMSRETNAHAFDIYRSLRRLNPSPYMFFFDFDELVSKEPLYLIGASPEMHVRLEERIAAIRPIAGTRRRGQTPAEDAALEKELLADPKERAEHVMLVDLARNDLGRVCDFGTVQVKDLMVIERYSHVMHIVSQVQGCLSAGRTPYDLMRATFPAGTLSGAPKIRAMQIIAELEQTARGPYGGCVGYFSFNGNLDCCITIRTALLKDGKAHVQSGGGWVNDSTPEGEFQETVNKAKAMISAVAWAEGFSP